MDAKTFVITLSCRDQLGIVAKISSFLAQQGGFILELAQFGDRATGRFFMRCVFQFQNTPLSPAQFAAQFHPIARDLDLQWQIHSLDEKPRVLILVSSQGHCLNDLLHRSQSGTLPIEVVAVASNHEDLKEMTEWYKIPFHHWPGTGKN